MSSGPVGDWGLNVSELHLPIRLYPELRSTMVARLPRRPAVAPGGALVYCFRAPGAVFYSALLPRLRHQRNSKA